MDGSSTFGIVSILGDILAVKSDGPWSSTLLNVKAYVLSSDLQHC